MHGSLIESHHRSSLNGNGGLCNLSSSEHALTDDEQTNKLSTNDATIILPASSNGKISKSCANGTDDDNVDEDESTTSTAYNPDFFHWDRGHMRSILTFCTVCLFAFMTGVEYAVILPTAFDYVKTMTNANIFVGLMLSSYSISGSIAGIIMGKVSDVTGRVKILLLISTLCEIGGNILYCVGNNIYIVLLGRLVSGVGMGVVPPILADIAHRTTEDVRTKAVSVILGCRQLGLLIGPCFTLLIRLMNFKIGNININNLNGPGFLMACVWVILEITCWFCFYDRTSSVISNPSSPLHDSENNNKQENKYKRSIRLSTHKKHEIPSKVYRDQYFRIEMFVLFLATFITYFNQTALETIVTAFTEKHFKWTNIHTSLLFAFAGLEILIVYIALVKIFSKYFKDRTLLIFGFISLTVACIIGVIFTWGLNSSPWIQYTLRNAVNKRLLIMFIIFVVLDLLALPFIAATSVSILTKLTNKQLQGFSQGLQRFIMGLGTIVGPLFASLLLNRLHIMMTTMICLTVLTLIAIFGVMKKLRPLSEKTSSNNHIIHENANGNTNNRKSLSIDEDNNGSEPKSTSPSKNLYFVLIQHDDDQNDVIPNGNGNYDTKNQSITYDNGSTNVLCLSEEEKSNAK